MIQQFRRCSKGVSEYPLLRFYQIKGLAVGLFRRYPSLQIILILLSSFVLNIKTNPNMKLDTIGIANITDIIPKSVSPATSHNGIAIKEMRIPIIIRILPTTFRIFFGIKSKINSNNKSTITTLRNC